MLRTLDAAFSISLISMQNRGWFLAVTASIANATPGPSI
nr:ANAPC7 protein [Homo sapiens]